MLRLAAQARVEGLPGRRVTVVDVAVGCVAGAAVAAEATMAIWGQPQMPAQIRLLLKEVWLTWTAAAALVLLLVMLGIS